MSGWEIPAAVMALVGATVHLSRRPAHGPGSVAVSPLLQAAVLACCLAWGALVGVGSLVAAVLLTWGHEPPMWPFALLGLLVAGACLAWLGRPWGRSGIVSRGRDVRAGEGGGL